VGADVETVEEAAGGVDDLGLEAKEFGTGAEVDDAAVGIEIAADIGDKAVADIHLKSDVSLDDGLRGVSGRRLLDFGFLGGLGGARWCGGLLRAGRGSSPGEGKEDNE
jgi:hypothetical protein